MRALHPARPDHESDESMLTTIEGTYHDGKIVLVETPKEAREGRVLVTFLNDAGPIILADLSGNISRRPAGAERTPSAR